MIFLNVLSHGKEINSLYEKDSIPDFSIYYYKDHGVQKSKDEYVIANFRNLFKLNNSEKGTNVVDNANTILWLNIRFISPLKNDLIMEFFPFYQKVTFYYFTEDSVMHQHLLGVQYPFSGRKYFSNSLLADLPSKTLNNYFIKYEFNSHFKIAAFQIKTYAEFFNQNINTLIIYTILFTSIFLIFSLAVIFYFLNKEKQYLFYGMYALFFALYAAACLHVWHLIPHFNILSHFTFIYYFPFSLATIFFALYILSSIGNSNDNIPVKILYGFLILKGFSILLSLWDVEMMDVWVNKYFTKLDSVIFGILLWLLITKTIRKPQITFYWLTFGVFLMFIGQIVHLIREADNVTLIFGFMCFDILWFGIGLSIHYKITKNEKIEALNNVIRIKSTYNKELEEKVEERTIQLQENIKVIDELNNILKINNITLSQNLAHLEQVRILNKELSFDEFKSQFPDKETCLQLLVNIKWNGKFLCNLCGNTEYFQIKKTDPYLRKCTQCNKIHSATTNTIFHNIKFPLEKAFYILFLTTSSKKYTVESISEMISLRPGTVTNFKKKVEETMELKKFVKDKNMTWQDLII